MPGDPFRVARRFCGPPQSGNGGYVAGRLAAVLGGPARVRLRRPPPLEESLDVVEEDGRVTLCWKGDVLAEAWPDAAELEAPDAPEPDRVERAAQAFRGFHQHPFPGCFVCGPDRAEGDGLRIFAGPLAGPPGGTAQGVAAPWTPDASLADEGGAAVRPEFLWAALDCPGAFALPQPEKGVLLLGEIAAAVRGTVRVGERCRLLAWPLGQEGRKRFIASAVYDAGGSCVATARATWIEVPAYA